MARTSFFITEKLGPNRSRTPEGFLICHDVPIARTGMMIYGPDETPIKPGPEGIAKIFREAEDVFRPETLASANGKPITDNHPDEDVVPDNWKELTHGITMNPRRGEGAMDDLMVADFMITTPEGIKAVLEHGVEEVSLGYDADYEEVSPGVGRQRNLIINHVALVEQGRCGPRCAIQDSKPTLKGTTMKKKSHGRFVDALMRAFKAKDADEVEAIAKEVQDELGETETGETHIHIHNDASEAPAGGTVVGDEESDTEGRATFGDDDIRAFMERNDAEHAELRAEIEELKAKLSGTGDNAEELEELKAVQDEVPEEMKEMAASAKDSAFLHDTFQDNVALAEILVPGIRIPTFDGSAKPFANVKRLCTFRRQALDLAYAQPSTRAILDDLLGGKSLDTKAMTCDAARTLFRSAAAAKRTANNHGGGRSSTVDTQPGQKKPVTLADINKRNAEIFGSSSN